MQRRLSKREFEILDLISLGLTTDQIASNLFLSSHTIITHRKNLLQKLEVPNTAGLVRKAYERGILYIQSKEEFSR